MYSIVTKQNAACSPDTRQNDASNVQYTLYGRTNLTLVMFDVSRKLVMFRDVDKYNLNLLILVRFFTFVGRVKLVLVHIVPSGFEYLTLSRVIPVFIYILYCNALRAFLFRFSARTNI